MTIRAPLYSPRDIADALDLTQHDDPAHGELLVALMAESPTTFDGGVPVTFLAQTLRLHPAACDSHIAALTQAGLVAVAPGAHRGRRAVVLTTFGGRVAQELASCSGGAFAPTCTGEAR